MKKKILFASISAIIFAALFVVLGFHLSGAFISKSTMAIDIQNAQTEFYVGEQFTYAGLVVKAHDGDRNYYNVQDYEVDSSKFDSKKIGTYEILVKYKNEVKSYNVKVVSNKEYFLSVFKIISNKNDIKTVESFSYVKDGEVSNWIGNQGYVDLTTEGKRHEIWIDNDIQYILIVEGDTTTATKSEVVNGDDFDINLTQAQNAYSKALYDVKAKVESGEYSISEVKSLGGNYTITLASEGKNYQLVYNGTSKIAQMSERAVESLEETPVFNAFKPNTGNVTLNPRPNIEFK